MVRLFLMYDLFCIFGACCPKASSNMSIDCEQGLPGWSRAVAVTPDVVTPCNTGSSGKCAEKTFIYVSGTGWCRPYQY